MPWGVVAELIAGGGGEPDVVATCVTSSTKTIVGGFVEPGFATGPFTIEWALVAAVITSGVTQPGSLLPR